jgi:hypothetical protein
VGIVGWWGWIHAIPSVPVARQTLPSPNAWDYYTEAGALLVNPGAIASALETGPERPGVTLLSPGEKAQVVEQNSQALKRLREGFRHECLVPRVPAATPLFPDYSRFRSLARLLRVEGRVRADRDDWAGALDSNLDSVQLGIDIERGAPMIGMLVGVAVRAMGDREAWEHARHLSAAQLRRAGRRFEMILRRSSSYVDVLVTEKQYGEESLVEMFRKPNWRRTFYGEMFSAGAGTPPAQGFDLSQIDWEEVKTTLSLYTVSNHRIMRNHRLYADQLIARARLPYGTAPVPEPPKDPVSQLTLGVFDSADKTSAKQHALDGLLLLRLALQAHRLERGRFPTSLQGLVPDYLGKLPLDPFGRDVPPSYVLKGSAYVLYSLGPDGKDDGGKPVEDVTKAKNSRARHQVMPDSMGDIVAGVNH